MEFTKDDLKTGMLIQDNRGSVMCVINDCLYGHDHQNHLFHYNEKMVSSYHRIDKVSKVLRGHCLRPENWNEETLNEHLLWERKPKETIKIGNYTYDKDEVEERLSDLKPIK